MHEKIIILNNIRSIFNVGSIFRTSEAFGVDLIYLCGITGTPENPRMQKTALSGFNSVAWQYRKSALRTVKYLKSQGYYVVGIEVTDNSIPIKAVVSRPIALVLGHERAGVDNSVLSECDAVMHIPMQGIGKSLNVAVAYGIAAHTLFKR